MRDVKKYDYCLRSLALSLARGDRDLADDVLSEMHVAVAKVPEGQSPGYYLIHAKWRAIDYLRSRRHGFSYGRNNRHVSLEGLLAAGIQIDTSGKVYEPKKS